MKDSMLINEEKAHEIASAITDPVIRNLVIFGIAEARMRVVRRVGQGEAEWRSGLPEQPFDMVFFAAALRSLFGKTDILRGVLAGQNLAEASGWDV